MNLKATPAEGEEFKEQEWLSLIIWENDFELIHPHQKPPIGSMIRSEYLFRKVDSARIDY